MEWGLEMGHPIKFLSSSVREWLYILLHFSYTMHVIAGSQAHRLSKTVSYSGPGNHAPLYRLCFDLLKKYLYFDGEDSGTETISQFISPARLLHAWIRHGSPLLLYDCIYCSVVCTWINRVAGVDAVSPWYSWIALRSAIGVARILSAGVHFFTTQQKLLKIDSCSGWGGCT